jgi:hypothetical protein
MEQLQSVTSSGALRISSFTAPQWQDDSIMIHRQVIEHRHDELRRCSRLLASAAGSRPLRVGAQKFAEALFLQRAAGKLKDSLRRCFLAGREPIAIEFKQSTPTTKPVRW